VTTYLFWSAYDGTWSLAHGTPKPAWVRDMERDAERQRRRPVQYHPAPKYTDVRQRPRRDWLATEEEKPWRLP
jgi:hypothetical protein